MGSRKNMKQKKSKRSGKILGALEIIYSGAWFIGKGERSGEYKESGNRIQKKSECRSKTIRKVGYGREKRF